MAQLESASTGVGTSSDDKKDSKEMDGHEVVPPPPSPVSDQATRFGTWGHEWGQPPFVGRDQQSGAFVVLPGLQHFESSSLVSDAHLDGTGGEPVCDVRRIPIDRYLGEAFLATHLPWAGSKLALISEPVSGSGGTATYSASLETQSSIEQRGALRIDLLTRTGLLASVTLTPMAPASVFASQDLPADPGEIVMVRLEWVADGQ